MIIKCPTNCAEHDYMFPHSLVSTSRMVKRVLIVSEFIICRECGHWINRPGRCNCRFRCHEETGGMLVQSA